MRHPATIAVLCALVFVVSCGTTEPDETTNNTTNSTTANNGTAVDQDEYFKWTIDGQEYVTEDDARFNGYLYVGIGKTVQINGTRQDGNTPPRQGIRINLFEVEEGDTGTFDASSKVVFVYTDPADPITDFTADTQNGGSGTLNVTRWDDYIEGTFEFTGTDALNGRGELQITNGSFRVAAQ